VTPCSLEYRHRRFKITSNIHHHGRLIYLPTARICQNIRRHIPESVCLQIYHHQISSHFVACYLVCVFVLLYKTVRYDYRNGKQLPLQNSIASSLLQIVHHVGADYKCIIPSHSSAEFPHLHI